MSMFQRNRPQVVSNGFTLVELLIAIVVIAILASISVGAYSNIQDRAYSTDLLSRTDAYDKGLKLYHIKNGRFPYYGESWGTCIGKVSDYPAGDGYSEGSCMKSLRDGVVVGEEFVSEAIMDELGTIVTSLPSGKIRESKESGTYGGQLYERYQRGLYYEHQNNPPGSQYADWAYIEYMYDGHGACPKSFVERYNEDTNTSFCSRIVWAGDGGID